MYFQRVSLLTNSFFKWQVTGVRANATFKNNTMMNRNSTKMMAMMIRDLEIAIPYEGYMMYAMEGVGNGAPSKRFRFRTKYNRKKMLLIFYHH